MERSAGVPPAAARIAELAREIPRASGLSNVLRLGQPYLRQVRNRGQCLKKRPKENDALNLLSRRVFIC
jgi:hypothetical protein